MRVVQVASAVFFIIVLAACSGSPMSSKPAERTNKEKLVGTWEVVKSRENFPPGTTLEFTRDGKVRFSVTDVKRPETMDGTYSLDGDTLNVTLGPPGDRGKHHTMKITKLTDKELITEETNPAGQIDERLEFKKK
jgi:uncharacterized protein (TIGR03066 family)